jgi:hypothetical protein
VSILKVNRGKAPVVVWRRGRWESMPHTVVMSDIGAITALTRCGREVVLGEGIDQICLTQITTEIFVAIGCGLCARALMSDLRVELAAAIPDARDRLRRTLDGASWADASTMKGFS